MIGGLLGTRPIVVPSVGSHVEGPPTHPDHGCYIRPHRPCGTGCSGPVYPGTSCQATFIFVPPGQQTDLPAYQP
jgi:hypothetical protein